MEWNSIRALKVHQGELGGLVSCSKILNCLVGTDTLSMQIFLPKKVSCEENFKALKNYTALLGVVQTSCSFTQKGCHMGG